MDHSQISLRTISTAALFLIASGAVLSPANAAAVQSESGINALNSISNLKASEANNADLKGAEASRKSTVQRTSEIRQATTLREQLRSAKGMESSRLQRLDAALAVIATATSTTDELGKAEAELDLFLATEQSQSPSQANLNQEQNKASSMQKKLDGVGESIIRNIAG